MEEAAKNSRLERLELYLREDPRNGALLAEAFEAALQAAKLDHAEFHLRHAVAMGLDGSLWSRLEAHLMLARHQWEEACALLAALMSASDIAHSATQGLAQDLAYARWRSGSIDAALQTLAPWLPLPQRAELAPASDLQVLWLRLMHRAGRLEEAFRWAQDHLASGKLPPAAAGVASLIALDLGDHSACEAWSDLALRFDEANPEALVSAASMALMNRRSQVARAHLTRALQLQPDDGRTWSAMGFCELLDLNLVAARAAFHRALAGLPEHIGTWHGLGWTELLAHDLGAARSAFESALDLDRNFGESIGALAVVQALAGERAHAEGNIERALRLDRNSLAARYAQSILSGNAQNVDALRQLAQYLFDRFPTPTDPSERNR